MSKIVLSTIVKLFYGMVLTNKIQINDGSKLTYGGPLYLLKYVATATSMS